jgi:hypothetical protein
MATDNLPYEGERTKANDKRIQPYTQGESSHNKTNGDLNKMDETSKKESLLTKWMKEDRRANPTCIVHWHRTSIQPPYQNGTRQGKAKNGKARKGKGQARQRKARQRKDSYFPHYCQYH